MPDNADRARATYRRHFGEAPALLARAPGRVNLIGEHTDYNDGFVLPCAIDLETVVAAGLAADGVLHSIAADIDDAADRWPLSAEFAGAGQRWADYVRAAAAVLAADGLAPAGARLAIAGDVPHGSGLSSSASLEVATGLALTRLKDRDIDPTQLAKLMQRAENRHVGTNCGIMDQLIATRGEADHALLIDCRSLHCRPVALPAGAAIVIAHSGVRHAHADGAYNDRRRECDAAAAHYGVAALRDLDIATLERGKDGLGETIYRRARHVVSENARTLAAADALAAGDLPAMGALMAQSHASMRDDFEITVPAIDALAAIMHAATGGTGGARMTGGGFGGCVVALAPADRVAAIREAVAHAYRDPAGQPAAIFVCRAVAGAGLLG